MSEKENWRRQTQRERAECQKLIHPAARKLWVDDRDKDMDIMELARQDGTMTVSGFVGLDITPRIVASVLREVGSKKTVRVDINSPGGVADDGMAIYNLLRRHKGDVQVHVLGIAGSAAQLIAMAGDRILMGRGTRQFIHNAISIQDGNRFDMLKTAGRLEKLDRSIATVISRRTGMSESDVAEMMAADTFLNADEAIDMNFASGYIDGESEGQGATASLEVSDTAVSERDDISRKQLREMLNETRAWQDSLTAQL